MVNLRDLLRRMALVGGLVGLVMVPIGSMAGVDLPKPEHGKGDKCVEPEDVMRHKHMDFLKHHRDETLRKGIRTTKYSLKKCVECHASARTGSVAAGPNDFCVSCHRYAAVQLDCWDCHATKPMQPKQAQPAQPALVSAPAATGVTP